MNEDYHEHMGEAGGVVYLLAQAHTVKDAQDVIGRCAAQPRETQLTAARSLEHVFVKKALEFLHEGYVRFQLREQAEAIRAVRLVRGDAAAEELIGDTPAQKITAGRIVVFGMIMEYIGSVLPPEEQEDFTRYYNAFLKAQPEETRRHLEPNIMAQCDGAAFDYLLSHTHDVKAAEEVIERCATQPYEVQHLAATTLESLLVKRVLASLDDEYVRFSVRDRAHEMRTIRLELGDEAVQSALGHPDNDEIADHYLSLGMLMDYIGSVMPFDEQKNFTRYYNTFLQTVPKEAWKNVETQILIACDAAACELGEIEPPAAPNNGKTIPEKKSRLEADGFSF